MFGPLLSKLAQSSWPEYLLVLTKRGLPGPLMQLCYALPQDPIPDVKAPIVYTILYPRTPLYPNLNLKSYTLTPTLVQRMPREKILQIKHRVLKAGSLQAPLRVRG